MSAQISVALPSSHFDISCRSSYWRLTTANWASGEAHHPTPKDEKLSHDHAGHRSDAINRICFSGKANSPEISLCLVRPIRPSKQVLSKVGTNNSSHVRLLIQMQ